MQNSFRRKAAVRIDDNRKRKDVALERDTAREANRNKKYSETLIRDAKRRAVIEIK